MADLQTDSGPVQITAEIGRSGLRQYSGSVHEEWDADLRGLRGIKTYQEMRASDPAIAAALRLIGWVIGQVEWTVQAGGDEPADDEARGFLESCLEDMSIPWSKVIRDALTMLPFGYSWSEVVYKVRNGPDMDPASRFDDGRIGWRKLVMLAQDSLARWQFDESGGVQAFVQQADYGAGGAKAEVVVPIEKSVLFRLDDEKGNPEGVSMLRPVYLAWYMRKQIQEIEAIGIERDLTGVLIIHMPVGASAADKTKAMTLLAQFKADDMSGFVAPQFGAGTHERWTFEIIASPGSKSIDTDKVIQRYGGEIVRSFLAQFLLLGAGGTGSWALSRDQSSMFEVALGAIVKVLEETINRFLIPPLFRLNDFGMLSSLPTIRAGHLARRNIDQFATALSTMAQNGLITPNAELERFIRSEMDLPELSDEEAEAGQAPEDTGDLASQAREAAEEAESSGPIRAGVQEDLDSYEAPAIPAEDDEAAWADIMAKAQEIIKGTRSLSEPLALAARPYNYAAKAEAIQQKFKVSMETLATDLRNGNIGWKDWAYKSQVQIMHNASAGYTLGVAEARGIAPSKVKLSLLDSRRLANTIEEQYGYFDKFSQEVARGIVAGDELTQRVTQRAGLYGGSVKGSRSTALVDGYAEDDILLWVRHAEDSCPTCLENQGKVMTAIEWREGGILPARGTACDGNCKCTFEWLGNNADAVLTGREPVQRRASDG